MNPLAMAAGTWRWFGVARAEEVELIIQGSDGEIRQKDSYGNDPRGIPG